MVQFNIVYIRLKLLNIIRTIFNHFNLLRFDI